MSATINAAAPKVARCEITFDFDTPAQWLRVTNTESKNSVTLELVAINRATPLEKADRDLIDALLEGDNGRTENLTGSQMKQILAIRDRIEVGKAIGVKPAKSFTDRINEAMWEDEQPIPPPAPVAPKLVVNASRTDVSTANNVTGKVANRTHASGTVEKAYQDGKLNSLRKMIEDVNSEDYVTFFYYIPAVLDRDCPNPSHLLWPIGMVRLDGSVWTCKRSTLDLPIVKEIMATWDRYRSRGLYYYHLDIGPASMATIRHQAQLRLDEEIRRIHTSLIDTIANADSQLREALSICGPVTERETEKADSYRDNRVRAALRKAAESLDAAIQCAERFDETMDVDDALSGLRLALESHKTAFNEAMREKGSKPV